ncbi:hypothetical protein D3C81_796400 [compost metagenome]
MIQVITSAAKNDQRRTGSTDTLYSTLEAPSISQAGRSSCGRPSITRRMARVMTPMNTRLRRSKCPALRVNARMMLRVAMTVMKAIDFQVKSCWPR